MELRRGITDYHGLEKKDWEGDKIGDYHSLRDKRTWGGLSKDRSVFWDGLGEPLEGEPEKYRGWQEEKTRSWKQTHFLLEMSIPSMIICKPLISHFLLD